MYVDIVNLFVYSLQITIPMFSMFPYLSLAYKREQKGKRVAAADRRKQKAVATQAAVTPDPQTLTAVPTTPQTAQLSIEPSTVTNVDSSGGGGTVTASGGIRAEGTDSCSSGRDEEAMETDTVIEQAGVGSATVVASVS